MNIIIRPYQTTDYKSVLALYQDSSTFGGQYDDARDTQEKLDILVQQKPYAILVAEINHMIVGTVTLFEDKRTAQLYRFAVKSSYEQDITQLLYNHAVTILKSLGHTQVLIYAPLEDPHLTARYTQLGMNTGNNYTTYWSDI